MPDSEELYYPYTIRCYRGCTLSSGISDFKSCADGVGVTDGFTSAHTAVKHDGYAHVKNPVKCLDGKEKTDYDWMNLQATTKAVCDFNGAASAAPKVALAAVVAGLVAML